MSWFNLSIGHCMVWTQYRSERSRYQILGLPESDLNSLGAVLCLEKKSSVNPSPQLDCLHPLFLFYPFQHSLVLPFIPTCIVTIEYISRSCGTQSGFVCQKAPMNFLVKKVFSGCWELMFHNSLQISILHRIGLLPFTQNPQLKLQNATNYLSYNHFPPQTLVPFQHHEQLKSQA